MWEVTLAEVLEVLRLIIMLQLQVEVREVQVMLETQALVVLDLEEYGDKMEDLVKLEVTEDLEAVEVVLLEEEATGLRGDLLALIQVLPALPGLDMEEAVEADEVVTALMLLQLAVLDIKDI